MTWPAAFVRWIIWLARIGPFIGGVVVFLLICAMIECGCAIGGSP